MIKFFIFVAIKVIDILEINKVSTGTWKYAKVLLSGAFGVFKLSRISYIYLSINEQEKEKFKPDLQNQTIACAPRFVDTSDTEKKNDLYPKIPNDDSTLAPF